MLWKWTNKINFKVKEPSGNSFLFRFFYDGNPAFSKEDFTGNTAYGLFYFGDTQYFSRKISANNWYKVIWTLHGGKMNLPLKPVMLAELMIRTWCCIQPITRVSMANSEVSLISKISILYSANSFYSNELFIIKLISIYSTSVYLN